MFIPQTEPYDHSAILLVLDDHGSHESTEFLWKCLEHNIYLLFLPPYKSHVLQPLDLTVFSSLERAYRKELQNLSSLVLLQLASVTFLFLIIEHIKKVLLLQISNRVGELQAYGR